VSRARVLPLLALAVVGGATGCASDTTATTELPTCATGDQTASHGVLLMAQSVPTASWVPCLRTTLPLGWTFQHLDARNEISRFWLNSDRDGDRAIQVRLEKSCDTAGATEIPSDQEGLRRFERVTLTTPRFEGKRYYTFDGGCINFTFRLDGESRGEALALATQSVDAISRADLDAQVHDASGGRLSLDPPTDEEK
jgi:hypothetical protein